MHSEPTPELQRKVKSMAMDKLRMEKLVAKLYSVSYPRLAQQKLAHETVYS